jgi:NADH-quinone oxidoreductase subunit H
VIGVSCLAIVLFLGGGTPLPFSDFPLNLLGTRWPSYWLVNGILASVFLVKMVGFAFVFFWVRATLPRMRVDRLMNFAWKYLVPLSIVNVLLAAVWFEVVMRPGRAFSLAGYRPLAWFPEGMTNWLVGWLVTLPLTVLVVWFVFRFNRYVAAGVDEAPTLTHGRHLPARAVAVNGS